MEKYLQSEEVRSVLADVVEHLGKTQPANVAAEIVSYLTSKAAVPTPVRESALSSEYRAKPISWQQRAEVIDKQFDGVSLEDDMESPVRDRGRRGAICCEPVDESPVVEKGKPKSRETKEGLEAALHANIMFSHLDADERGVVFDAMFDVEFEKGDVIIRQGEEGDNFYVIESGKCDIYVKSDPDDDQDQPSASSRDENDAKEKKKKKKKSSSSQSTSITQSQSEARDFGELVLTLSKGGLFGELALIYESPRAATVVAATHVKLWAIDRGTYRRILMGTTMKKRRLYEKFLERVPILAHVTKYERITVADALESFYFAPGETIIKEGDPGDRFYIIVKGSVRVTQTAPTGETGEVAQLGESDYFGEIALLANRPRAATVTAIDNVKCVGLDRERFNRVLGPCEDILRRNLESYNRFMAGKI